MIKRLNHQAVLDGINTNIEITERQINDLETELNKLHQDEASIYRKRIMQQLSVLKENLQLLKVRRVYVMGPDFSPEKREGTQAGTENIIS
jgi:hypothetical protein